MTLTLEEGGNGVRLVMAGGGPERPVAGLQTGDVPDPAAEMDRLVRMTCPALVLELLGIEPRVRSGADGRIRLVIDLPASSGVPSAC